MIHMLLIKGYLRFGQFQVQRWLVMSDQTETDSRRLKIDQQINRKLNIDRNTWETDMDKILCTVYHCLLALMQCKLT